MLTPCTIIGTATEPDLSEISMTAIEYLREELGIQAVPSPTWEQDYETICQNAGDELCSAYQNIESTWQP